MSKRLLALVSSTLFKTGVFMLFTATLLYVLGIEFFLPLTLVALYALFFPLPAFLRSFLSRFMAGLLIFYAVYQLATVIQFFVFPQSGFNTAAVITTLVSLLLLLSVGRRQRTKIIPVITKEDFFALSVALICIIPISYSLFSANTVTQGIASIGAIQGNDGTTHFSILTDSVAKERMTYAPGAIYYPAGFHLTTAFIENAYGIDHLSFGWDGRVALYFSEFLLFAAVLAYLLYYSVLGLLSLLGSKYIKNKVLVFIVPVLGTIYTLFYALPFIYHGFLNYYYVCAALILGFIILSYEFKNKTKSADQPSPGSFGLIGLLILFGAASSWPLFSPIILAVAAMLVFSAQFKSKNGIHIFSPSKKQIAFIGFGMLLQVIPLYLQLSYASVGTADGLNATGGLKVFHPQFLMLTAGLTAYFAFYKGIDDSVKRIGIYLLIPSLMAVLCLASYQYFELGEIRYYVIKLAMFLELMTFVFLVAVLSDIANKVRMTTESLLIIIVAIPLTFIFSLMAINDNPMRDVRSLFRNYSGEPKPAYVDQDVRMITELGSEGKVQNYNVITLHYTDDQSKLFAHPQTMYWANSLAYNSSSEQSLPKNCFYKIYINLTLGTFTPSEQAELVTQVNSCVDLAKASGKEFYIVTDQRSSSGLIDTFGARAKVVW